MPTPPLQTSTPDYPGHDLFLPYLLTKMVTLLNVHLQRLLDTEGLTLTHWRVLAFLSSQDGLTVGALAEATMTEQSTLSRSLRVLEQLGHVSRVASDADSRAVHVHMNEQGHEVFRRMLDKALTIEAGFLRGVSKTDVANMRATLLKMIANA